MRQCPRCELRFALDSEVRDHLAHDHDVDVDALHHLQPPAARVGTRLDPDAQARRERRQAATDDAARPPRS